MMKGGGAEKRRQGDKEKGRQGEIRNQSSKLL